jgi:hypothetical protein
MANRRWWRSARASLALAAFLCASPVGTSVALADSDGYYCVGPDYLAYQFGFAAPPVGPHRLYVIRLGGESDQFDPIALDIPQFQAHGMACDDRSVRMAAYDAIYTIDLDTDRRPTAYVAEPRPNRNSLLPELRNEGNLGMMSYRMRLTTWGAARRDLLLRTASGNEFVLEFVPDPQKTDECQSEITTRLLELDSRGEVVRALAIFRGLVIRECVGD